MKKTKQILAMILAVMLIAALSVSAFAANDGSVTISNAKTGETYSLYKIFDATVGTDGTIAYIYNGTLPENDFFAQDASTKYITAKIDETTKKPVAQGSDGYLTEAAITFLGTLKGTAVATHEATAEDGDTVVFSNLPYGYYYVESTLGAVVSIDSTNPTATIVDKNTKQEIAKWIIEGNNKVKANDVNVGGTIQYQIEVPLYQYDGTKKITEYYVFDEMHDALTYNGDLAATLNGNAFTAYTVAEKTTSDPYAFRVAVPIQGVGEDGKYNGTFLYDNNDVVIFTYSVTVDEDIVVASAMENTAKLDWDTNKTTPDEKEIPATPTPDRPKDETKSYSVELKVCKVDDKGKPLTGAKFSISGLSTKIVITNKEIYVKDASGEFWRLKDGTYTKDAPVIGDDPATTDVTELANTDLYESITQKYSKVETIDKTTKETTVEAEGWVDGDGIMTFTGLGAGTYTITELVAPNGYNLLKAPITVVVSFDDTDKPDGTKATYTFSAKVDNDDVTCTNGVISFNVVNQSGTVLPSTGGIGTTIFYIAGAVLAVGAAIILFAKKRVNED